MEALRAGFEMVRAGGITEFGGAAYGSKAAASQLEPPVPPGGRIFLRGKFDDAAELAAVFGRVTGRENPQGFDIARVERRSERRRAVLRQRHSVDNILHLVFRTARVQSAVRFVKPARLVVDGVGKRATGLGRSVFAQGFAAERVNGRGLGRVEERRGVVDFNARAYGRDAQGHRDARRYFAANLDQIGPRRKALGGNGKAINAERKLGSDVSAFRRDRKIALELV